MKDLESHISFFAHDIRNNVGIAISYLRPSGKAEFDNSVYEVSSHDEFITSGTTVIVEKIDNRKIFVKPKT